MSMVATVSKVPCVAARTAHANRGHRTPCGNPGRAARSHSQLANGDRLNSSSRALWHDALALSRGNSSAGTDHGPGPRGKRLQIVASSASTSVGTFSGDEGNPNNKLSRALNAFWKFLRPHTIRGTILGSTAVTAKAIVESPALINWGLLPTALLGVLALVCGNGYIVGINQIYDKDIDEVNKPFLPIAAGELSKAAGWFLVMALGVLGSTIVHFNFAPLVFQLYMFGLFLGTIYSVPPLRLKRSPLAAFLIIATVRGFLLNFGVYHATKAALGSAFAWSPPILFITCFVTVFACVIAITKDLPDVKGDMQYNIDTFATRLGVRKLAYIGGGLLMANYIAAAAAAFIFPGAFNTLAMAVPHMIAAALILYQLWLMEKANYTQVAIKNFYRFIWNMFYCEYALLPFI